MGCGRVGKICPSQKNKSKNSTKPLSRQKGYYLYYRASCATASAGETLTSNPWYHMVSHMTYGYIWCFKTYIWCFKTKQLQTWPVFCFFGTVFAHTCAPMSPPRFQKMRFQEKMHHLNTMHLAGIFLWKPVAKLQRGNKPHKTNMHCSRKHFHAERHDFHPGPRGRILQVCKKLVPTMPSNPHAELSCLKTQSNLLFLVVVMFSDQNWKPERHWDASRASASVKTRSAWSKISVARWRL